MNRPDSETPLSTGTNTASADIPSNRRDEPADTWGIHAVYEDALGQWRTPPAATRHAILTAMGVEASAAAPPPPSNVLVLSSQQAVAIRAPAQLECEDGTVLACTAEIPANLPLGYHTLRWPGGDARTQLIVSPGKCHLPERRRWGWSVQLYALRSQQSWGIGDLADLGQLAEWSAQDLGADILLVNPLHAAIPVLPQQPSPYFPSSRRYRNLLYLHIEDVPGATEVDLERLAGAGRALNRHRRIDHDAVFRLKIEALRRIWERRTAAADFDRYCAGEGDGLRQFAVFCTLAEQFGVGWPSWPEAYHRPEAAAVTTFADEHADRIRFHQWVQWLFAKQLADAAAALPVMQDLPIGVDPGGADAWGWQDLLARNVSVGAPPDEYNTRGQDWGLPPFIPHKLRQAAYAPFIATVRATLQHAGGIRIDHAMGLFRLFWIPRGSSPTDGTYVRYPTDDLLAILALESHRARALVVGEDLGTLEPGARERLTEQQILSYRLLWFETCRPAEFPELSLAAVTTHDLPTIAGVWTGTDLRLQQRLGLQPNEAGMRQLRERLRDMIGVPDDAELPEVVRRTHTLLAEAPSLLVTATMEDALAVSERPNMPGTTGEQWPNWSVALPRSLEEIVSDPLVRDVAAILRQR